MKYPKLILLSVLTVAIGLLFVAASPVPRQSLWYPWLQTDMNGGNECITNLSCLQVGAITSGSLNVSNLILNGTSISSVAGNVNLLEVFNMKTNLVLQGATNRYWMDMAHTNHGAVDIYATLTPTNDAQFELPTNGFRGGLLSFNVLARGANRTLFFPTNFAAFDTNDSGFILAGSRYVLYLTNGNEFRCSIQSNDTYSVLTKVVGQ